MPGSSQVFTTYDSSLQTAIQNRHAKVAVIGLGYVGLPMAVAFAEVGYSVQGIDTDPVRCKALMQCDSYVAEVDNDILRTVTRESKFHAGCDFSVLSAADVILICVPTPLRKSKDPDLSFILAASEAVSTHLRQGQLIILESTTYPGTTEEILLPIFEKKGLKVGRDFFLAFSPERVDPGNPKFTVRNITKLVGGVTPACGELATAFYRQIVTEVVMVSNTRVAETAKLLENTFRSVNIALVNEMVLICRHLDIDVWEVIRAASTKPFAFMPHYPGPGLGGHCIPLDPHYLAWKVRLAGYEPRFIALATDINKSMPHHVVDLVVDALNDQGLGVRKSRILLLGMAYKRDINDYRESPALDILSLLLKRGGLVEYSDSYIPEVPFGGKVFFSQPITPEMLKRYHCVVVVTNHSDFDYEMIVRNANVVIDTRNATREFAPLGNVHFL